MVTSCSPSNQNGEYLRWTFTEPLGTCIYNGFDEISFIIGWLCVTVWCISLFPQIIVNYKNKSAESQSFWLWVLWGFADIFNLIGCILTKNLTTNIALACVYLTMTSIACFQFIWYSKAMRKYYLFKRKLLIARQDESLYKSPSINQRTVKKIQMSPNLKSTLKMIYNSPRMFAVSPMLKGKLKDEYDSIQAKYRRDEEKMAVIWDEEDNKSISDDDDSIPSGSYYGATHTNIINAVSSMSMTIVMIYGMNNSIILAKPSSHSTRHLLSVTSSVDNEEISGLIIGWIASVIYIFTRIPQLGLMLKTKNVSGLSSLFFWFSFIGNTAQCTSMLFSSELYTISNNYFLVEAPWLITSFICGLQDLFILVLISLYSKHKTDIDKYVKYDYLEPDYSNSDEETALI